MQARFEVVDLQLKTNTLLAIDSALEHLLDMLRLNRGDNQGVRSLVPALYLRLNRDQECYDFVKWWVTTGQESKYEWGNPEFPYLDVKDADAFEDVDGLFYGRKHMQNNYKIAATLIKIRVLIDLKRLLKCKQEAAPDVEKEVFRDTFSDGTLSDIVVRYPKIWDAGEGVADPEPYIGMIKGQIKNMYKAVEEGNQYFWKTLVSPGDSLRFKPGMYIPGDRTEVNIEMQYWYNAWVETPGAIGIVEELVKGGKVV